MLKASMKSTLLAGVALIATTIVASAQDTKENGNAGKESPPAAANPSPPSAADKAPGRMKEEGTSARDEAPGRVKPESESARDEAPGRAKRDGYTVREEGRGDAKAGKQAESNAKDADRHEDGDKTKQARDAEGKGEKAGKGSLTDASPQQKTKVREVFSKHRVAPARDIDISVSVGVVVPRKVKFYPVPRDIVLIVPAYEDYLYFEVEDRICIVDPVSYKIVEIIVIA